MLFRQISDPQLAQYAYIIGCQQTGEAIVVDPERDIDRYIQIAEEEGLQITAAVDTHIHADYLTGLREFAERGVKVYAPDEGGDDWRYNWLINSNGQYKYVLLKDRNIFNIGNITFEARHTPGHTPEHMSYLVTDGAASEDVMGILSGDFVFVGDVGRPDLLETAAGMAETKRPAAQNLYKSINQFKNLPEYLQVWPAHGAGSACGKALGAVPESTVGYELRNNISISAAESQEQFVDFILQGQPEPPLYFSRMKRDNKEGPRVLGTLPQPAHLDYETFRIQTEDENTVIIDTRSIGDYMNGHLPNSILAPFNRSFPTVAGSYVQENEKIYLICDSRDLQRIVESLIRIGLDDIAGYTTPDSIHTHHEQGEQLPKINMANFKEAEKLLENDAEVLDVRGNSEFEEGHIHGAKNIVHTRLADSMDQLDKSKQYIVHCRMGGRAAVATAFLNRNGYDVTFIDDFIVDYLNRKP